MTNNDILRRIRYASNFDDMTATRVEISDWLMKDDDPD